MIKYTFQHTPKSCPHKNPLGFAPSFTPMITRYEEGNRPFKYEAMRTPLIQSGQHICCAGCGTPLRRTRNSGREFT